MKKKELLASIGALFAKFNSDEVQDDEQEVKFVDVTTEDGRVMRVADVVIDQPIVEIVDGEEQAVEDGTYVLEDGTSLVVVEGIITEVIAAEEEEAPQEEEMSEVSDDTNEEDSREEKTELEDDVLGKLYDVVSKLNDKVDSLEAKFEASEKESNDLKEKVEEFAAAPSDEHTETKAKFSIGLQKKEGNSPLHQKMKLRNKNK